MLLERAALANELVKELVKELVNELKCVSWRGKLQKRLANWKQRDRVV